MAETATTAAAATENEEKEAQRYWGYLFREDRCGTDRFNRLLAGIAHYIVRIKLVHGRRFFNIRGLPLSNPG